MIVFENINSVIYDKINIDNIEDIATKLECGKLVYDNFCNIRLSEYANELQVVNLKNALPEGYSKCEIIEIRIRSCIENTLREVFGPILDRGFNLNELFSLDYLDMYLTPVEFKLKKRKDVLGTQVFNPTKMESFNAPEIFRCLIDNKVLASYVINSETLIVNCYNKDNPFESPKNLSDDEKIEFANKLFFTERLKICSVPRVIRKGNFDITISLKYYPQLEYQMVYDESIRIDEIIESVKNNEVSIALIAERYLIPSVILAIITKNPYNIENIPSMRLIDEDYKLAVSLDGGVLALIPEDRKTLDICKIAVENEPYAKEFVPKHLYNLDFAK